MLLEKTVILLNIYITYIFQERNTGNQEDSTAVSSGDGYIDLDSPDEEYDYDGNSSDSSDSGDECWDETPLELLRQDLHDSPLPEPARKKNRLQRVNVLVHWFVYFLLIWQASCQISDNGLCWLLRFLFKFFQVLGIYIEDEHLADLIKAFPTSIYLLWQYLGLDRDNFTKYVVCPNCTKLYGYEDCVESVGGKTVGKTCTNTVLKRGRRDKCGAQLTKRVILKEGKEQFYPI